MNAVRPSVPTFLVSSLVVVLAVAACAGEQGPPGPSGPPGPGGESGSAGASGSTGASGADGADSDGGASSLVPAPPAREGSRLKLRATTTTTTMTAADGAQTVTTYPGTTWFDAERGEPCSFTAAADGVPRCLPVGLALGDSSFGLYYQDPTCRDPIAVVAKSVVAPAACGTSTTPGRPSPKYLLQYVPGSPCGGQTIRPLGAPLTPTTVYVKSGTTCYPTPASATVDYSTVPSEIPPASFVASSTVTVVATQ